MVINLCTIEPKGNERVKAAALFNIGSIHLQNKQNSEAKKFILDAMEVIKVLLVQTIENSPEYLSRNKTYDLATVTVAELIEPSIFDDNKIKELKEFLTEMEQRTIECDEELE